MDFTTLRNCSLISYDTQQKQATRKEKKRVYIEGQKKRKIYFHGVLYERTKRI